MLAIRWIFARSISLDFGFVHGAHSGALLFDMVTGSPPFVAHNRKKTMEKITKAQPRFPPFLTNEIKVPPPSPPGHVRSRQTAYRLPSSLPSQPPLRSTVLYLSFVRVLLCPNGRYSGVQDLLRHSLTHALSHSLTHTLSPALIHPRIHLTTYPLRHRICCGSCCAGTWTSVTAARPRGAAPRSRYGNFHHLGPFLTRFLALYYRTRAVWCMFST